MSVISTKVTTLRQLRWIGTCTALLVLVFTATPLRSATFTWDGGGSNNFLNAAANWNPDGAPPFNGTADLIFAGGTRLNPFVLDTIWSVDGLAFDNTAGAFSIFGNPLHIGAGGITNNSVATETLNNLYVDAAQTWNAAAGDLKFDSLYASGAARTLTIDGAYNTTISGSIDNGSGATSALDLIKTGSGTLTLNGSIAKRLNSGLYLADGTVALSGAPVGGTTSLVSLEGNLLIGIAGLDGQNAILNVNLSSPGLAITQIAGGFTTIGNGPPVSPHTGIYVGAATGGPAALNIGNGGIVETGATGLTIHATGTVNIGSDTTTGTLKFYGNVVVDGGTLNQHNGSSFVPYSGTTLTVQNGGRFQLANAYTFSSGRAATVTGAGSVLETAEGFVVDTGSLFVQNGGAVSTASYLDVGRNADGALNIDGPGSLVYAAGGVASVWGTNGHEADIIIDHQANVQYAGGLSLVSGTGLVYVSLNHGAQLSAGPMLSLNAGDSGSISFLQVGQPGVDASGTAVKIDPSGQLIIGTSFTHYTGNVSSISVFSGASLIVGTGGTTHLNKTGVLVIDGGTVDLQNLPVYDGQLLFDSGSLSYRGYLDVGPNSPAAIKALGDGSQRIAANRSLTVSSGTYIHDGYTLTLDGGTLNTSFLYSHYTSSFYTGAFDFSNGTLGITGPDGLVVGLGGTGLEQLGHYVSVEPNSALNVAHALTISDGYILLDGGTITAGTMVNNNIVDVFLGGTLNTGGLTNHGAINFRGGNTEIYGNVTNDSGTAPGLTLSGAVSAATVTFWGDVTNTAGSVFSVSPGSAATFNGDYVGNGTTGGGDIHFAAGISPGFSPAAVSFEGGVTLDSTAMLKIELGGTAVGSEFDHVTVDGNLVLDGVLSVTLVNSFLPGAGDTFDILDWATLSGTFSSINLPDLARGLTWNTTHLYTDGILSVDGSLAGDYNGDGAVDSADYIVWRKGLGTIYTQADYDVWRAHFGQTAGSGAAVGANVAAPEPATVGLLMFAVAGLCLRRSLPHRHYQQLINA